MTRIATCAVVLAIWLLGPACGPRATSAPSAFAWHELLTASKPFAQDKSLATWETWTSKKKLFQGNPSPPPDCGTSYPRKVLQESMESRMLALELKDQQPEQPSFMLIPPNGLNFEVRFNKVFCEDVVRKDGPGLWTYPIGQETLFKQGKDAVFPDGSVALKAYWEPGPCSPERYHCGKDSSGSLRLRAIHLATKQPDTPNWFWATWEHEDEIGAPGYTGLCCKDDFGFDGGKATKRLLDLMAEKGVGPEWSHYRLVGTQFEYMENGAATKLSNVVIEGPANAFRESCITCHARATTDRSAFSTSLSTCDMECDPAHQHAERQCDSTCFRPAVGLPQSRWYTQADGSKKYVRTGFVWSAVGYPAGS